MDDHLKQYYFQKASSCALLNDISGALEYMEKLDISMMDDSFKKLKGLCLYRLGNYKEAINYAGVYPEYKELHNAYLTYSGYIDNVKKHLENKNINAAHTVLKQSSLQSVNEYNLLGCVSILLKNKKQAKKYFYQAIQLDCYNKTTIRLLTYMENEVENDIGGWLFRLFSKR